MSMLQSLGMHALKGFATDLLKKLDVIYVVPKHIGKVPIAVVIEETYTDELEITAHPVETGADITDHAYKQQPEVVLKCGWSNAQYTALLGGAVAGFDSFGAMTSANYIDSVYSRLLKLQADRIPVDIVTSRRKYQNILIRSLVVKNDAKTSAALMLTATCKQIRMVKTKATTLPPRDDQADPSRTAETTNTGTKQAKPATPSPGGSAPPH